MDNTDPSTEVGLIENLAQQWHQFYDRLQHDIRVLVVDDEPVVSEVVEAILEGAGWQVQIAETAEQAWELIQCKEYGLLVSDKNLPGMSGVELISKIKTAGIGLPSLMITGYASVESISNALAAGASDYITKPFDDVEHVRKRATSIIERSLLARLYDRIVKDLVSILSDGGQDQDQVRRIGQQLFAFKSELNRRPDLLMVADDKPQAHEMAAVLRETGLDVRLEHSPEEAYQALAGPDAPLAAALSLQMRFPVAMVTEMRNFDPLLNVIVTSASPRLVDALAAVEAGAVDFYIQAVERIEALQVRARRAVNNSHQARLYLQLIAILHAEASAQGHPVIEAILDLLPHEHRDYLQRLTQPLESDLPEIAVDLSELFTDLQTTMSRERRQHRRLNADDVEVWYRPKGAQTPFARGWLRDVSRGGFFLRTSPPIECGIDLEAHLLIKGDSPLASIQLNGRAVRKEIHNPDPDRLSGSGILVSEQFQTALDPLVARLSS